MFNIIKFFAFPSSTNSTKFDAYSKSLSLIDRLVISLISNIFSTICKNIPFFYKKANKDSNNTDNNKLSSIKDKSLKKSKDSGPKITPQKLQIPTTAEQNKNLVPTSDIPERQGNMPLLISSAQQTDNAVKIPDAAETQSPNPLSEGAINQHEKPGKTQGDSQNTSSDSEKELNESSSSDSSSKKKLESSKKKSEVKGKDSSDDMQPYMQLDQRFPAIAVNQIFPQDYANELNQFHKTIPTIKCKDPIIRNDYLTSSEYHAAISNLIKEITEELQKPIKTPSQLVMMVEKWLRLEGVWGNNFDDIYCVTKIEEGNGTETLEELFKHEYDKSVFTKYRAIRARIGEYDAHSVYKWELKKILRTPECLKNLILMFGLEYSVIVKTGGKCGGQQAYHYPQFQQNSAINILNDEYCTQALIKIPLIHLAVAQRILPEFSFLLTEDNVNCKSYQGFHYVPQKPKQLEQEAGMVLQNTLVILDTPLKIALDNFDDVTIKLLLENNANPAMMVRSELGRCDARPNSTWDYYVYYGINQCQPLYDYFLEKIPRTEHETTSYIEIANLLYSYLGTDTEEAKSFAEKAQQKIIPSKDSVPSISLYEHIQSYCPKKTKSANQGVFQDSGELPLPDIQEEEIKKVKESSTAVDDNTTLPNITGSVSYDYEPHVSLAGYQAFASLNHLTIEYHEL
jgi:hypothetical protein